PSSDSRLEPCPRRPGPWGRRLVQPRRRAPQGHLPAAQLGAPPPSRNLQGPSPDYPGRRLGSRLALLPAVRLLASPTRELWTGVAAPPRAPIGAPRGAPPPS